MIRPFARLNRCALPLALAALCSLGSSTLLAETGDAHTHSQPASAITAQAARESASARTLELLTLHKQWLKAPANERAALHRQLQGKAEQRRQLLDDLMQSHPAEVLRVAIPEEQQQGMPAAVLEFLEQKLELEGELEVVYEDYEDGTHKLRQFLKTPFGERFELHFAGKSPQHQSGTEVRIHGLLLEGVAQEQSLAGTLALESADSSVETLACCTDTGSTSSTSAPELPYTLGEQKTLAILVNFQDKPSERTTGLVTVNDWHNQIFGEVNDFYRENSDGQTWLSGDTVGWFTIPQNSTSCNQWGIASDAKAAASNAGVDLSAYNRFIFVFPWNSACGWGGQGTVGGASSSAWINGQPGLYTTAHELGHNLGLGHSEFLDCDISPLGDSCSRMQYGDYLDVMGGSPSGHFNGFQKERLGWLPASGIQAIETSGNYVVDSYIGSATGKPKVLKVLKGVDAQTGAKSWYYLESRQAKGFDSFIADSNYVITANVLNGVVIHQATEGVYNSSRLLDMTPGSSRLDDMKDPALETGYSFSDPDAGASITTMWVDSVQAQLSVDIGAQPCIASVPTVEVTPGQSDWVAAGTTETYSVTVTSNDSATCSSSTVSLSAYVPSGWSKALSNNAFDLAAGEAVTVSLDVTSSSSAVDGFYDITLTASNAAGNSSASASYIVSNPLANAAPTASNDTATTDEDTAVSVSVLANDGDPDGDVLSITTFSQGSNGAVTFGNSGILIYTPKSGFSGTDSFSYTVSDGKGGTDNAVVNITVNAVIGNSAPVALDDRAETTKGSSVTISVLSNDTDPDGDQLALASATQGAKGSVTLNGDGTLTYTAAGSFRDGDSFSYVISDGTTTAAATVNISLAQSSVDSGKGNGGTKGGGKPQQ